MTVLTLHIHRASSLTPLAESLATMMSTPLADPFTAEVVGVPTVGVRDWLQQRLALRLGASEHDDGVSANIEMVFPHRFIAAALGGYIDDTSPWDLDRLTWAVLQVIESGRVSIPGRRTGSYSTARRIADLFDRYANNRPQLLQQWNAGHLGDGTEDERQAVVPLAADHEWQAHLWQAVRHAIGQPTSAERLPELLADLRAGRIEPQLPERVALFGLSAVSSSQLAVVQALATVRDVHLHLVHPSRTGWQRCRHQLAGRLVLRSTVDATAAVQHTLLRSWGRPPMETTALVAGLDVVVEHLDPPEGSLESQPLSLLKRIQADIGRDQPVESGAFGATGQDRSIQLHACHGTTRQIEVLRDALGHLFAADPSLAAHEVAILCPDLDRFAPLLQSVFQRSSLPIPVRVSDLSLGAGNSVATALATLLNTIAGRCTAADILQLIALDPISRQFGFDDEDAELINRWLDELGTTWGLDGDHRGEFVPSHIVEGTWSATLDRLLLGGAMPAPWPRVGPGGVVPFDDVDANGMAVAGRLAELVAQLRDAKQRCSGRRGISEWSVLLLDLIDGFLATHIDDVWQTAEIIEEISAIAANAARAADNTDTNAIDVPLTLSDARLVLAGALGGDRGRLAMRSGAVTASAFLPVRNVPNRVVCVLGLDDASMRSAGIDGDDILGLRPCIGERDPRVEGRHMLLDALMAAGEHFVVTFDGSDITTNRPLPSPVHLAELIEAIEVLRRGESTTSTPIITRHPRQAYDERNFGAGVDGQPDSFDTAMLAAAIVRRSAVAANEPWPLLSSIVPAVVDLAQLTDSCIRPERTLLHGRLDVRLPPQAEELDANIPLRFVGLDTYQLGRELLELHRQGADEAAIESWRQANRSSGALPPRALADATLDDTAREVDLVTKCRVNGTDVAGLMRGAVSTFDVDIHRPVDDPLQQGGAGQVIVRDTIRRLAGDQLVRVSFTRPGNRSIVAAALDLAALVATDPQRPWHALVVNRPRSGSFKVAPVDVRPRDRPDRQDRAIALIDTALAFHLRALREPLPLFERSSRTLADHETIDDDELTRDIRSDAAQLLWGTYTADDILAISLRADEEMSEITGGAGGRAKALADYLWTAVREFVDLGDDRSPDSDGTGDATIDGESSDGDRDSAS